MATCNNGTCDLQHNLYNMNPIDRILAVFAPESCVNCMQEGAVLCFECRDTIETLPSICYACGRATRTGKPCEKCITRSSPAHVWVYTAYNGTAKDVISAYKFDEKRSAALPIAQCLDSSLPYFASDPLVTFVPTATSHSRQRGFDHAGLMARELSRLRNWHYARLLHRNSQVRQIGSTRQQRKKQLQGAFSVVNKRLVENRHILLVDDVITTGSTIEECAKVLLLAGAKQVDVVVFARTP